MPSHPDIFSGPAGAVIGGPVGAHPLDPALGPHTGTAPESNIVFNDAAGHNHSGAGNTGAPANRYNSTGAILNPGTYNDITFPGLANAEHCFIDVNLNGTVIITGIDSSSDVNQLTIYGAFTGSPKAIQLNHLDAGSLPQNRIDTGAAGLNLVFQSGDYVTLIKIPGLGWVVRNTGTNWNVSDHIWARSSDPATSGFWQRFLISASQFLGRKATGGLIAIDNIKERFNLSDPNATTGYFRTRSIGPVGSHEFDFRVPDDYGSLVAAQLIGIAGGTNAAAPYNLYSDYGPIGGLYNTFSQSALGLTIPIVANEIFAVPLNVVFTNIAAGHYCGVRIMQNGWGTNAYYLGVRFAYKV